MENTISIQKLSDRYKSLHSRLSSVNIDFAAGRISSESALNRITDIRSQGHGIFLGVDAMAPPGYSEELHLCSDQLNKIRSKSGDIESVIYRAMEKTIAK